MLYEFASLAEIPKENRELRDVLLEAAILWHKVGVRPTVGEALRLDKDERDLLAEAFDIVHGYALHPDDVLPDAVRQHAANLQRGVA